MTVASIVNVPPTCAASGEKASTAPSGPTAPGLPGAHRLGLPAAAVQVGVQRSEAPGRGPRPGP